MKKEFKKIKKVSKKVIGHKNFKKIKKIKDSKDRTEGLKYLVNSKLKERLLELESKVQKIDEKEALIAKAKLHRLHAKIAIFNSTYSQRDLKVLENLIKEIEEEINGVK